MAEVKRDIRLQQLVGRTDDGREVGQAVDEIFLNGVRIGYVGHSPTDPINFIRPGVLTDRETLAEIRAAVVARLGGTDRRANGVPEITSETSLDRAEGIDTADDRAE